MSPFTCRCSGLVGRHEPARSRLANSPARHLSPVSPGWCSVNGLQARAGSLDLVIAPEAAPREVLEVVSACGRLLSTTVASAGAGPVAWHWGMSDAAGFAAMGVAEALVHTHDITQGLGVA